MFAIKALLFLFYSATLLEEYLKCNHCYAIYCKHKLFPRWGGGGGGGAAKVLEVYFKSADLHKNTYRRSQRQVKMISSKTRRMNMY